VKTIGLIGGISWQATVLYYQIINDSVQKRLGKLHSAKVLIKSLDFEEIVEHQRREEWKAWEEKLTKSSLVLEGAGADLLLLCCNTAHKAAETIQDKLSIPLIHIADAASHKVIQSGIDTVGLLGTQLTMEEGFYKDRMKTRFNLSVLIPDQQDRYFIDRTIFEELGKGVFKENTKKGYLDVIEKLVGSGAQGIVLGCTEICLLIKQEDLEMPIFDTATIHAAHAVDLALS
jgi:aspartate racemase